MLKDSLIFLISVSLIGFGPVFAAPPKQAKLWEPVDWEFQNPGHKGNPFDLVAKATFTHIDTGQKIRTELFYDAADTWKLRFTGTRTGQWRFVTESTDSDLDGHCLKIPAKLLVFYKEDAGSIKMNLGELRGKLHAVAVDTKNPYREIELTGLKPEPARLFKAPHRSDWAIAVEAVSEKD